jgi:hypothetical protein
MVEMQHGIHFVVGVTLANPCQLEIQNRVAVIFHHDDGDIGLFPGHRPKSLNRVHATPVAFKNNGLPVRAGDSGDSGHP